MARGPDCTGRDLERAEGLGDHCFKSDMKHLRDTSGLHYVLLLHGQAQPLLERTASTEVFARDCFSESRTGWHDVRASQSSL